MTHPVLGEIDLTSSDIFDGRAKVKHGTHNVVINLSRNDEPLDTVLDLAAQVVSRLYELDPAAKQIAAAELLDTYNGGWNSWDVVQKDGTLKSVRNPELSPEEFKAKLTLDAISVSGEGIVQFYYDDEEMFWGHCVSVTSLNGTDFSEATAEFSG